MSRVPLSGWRHTLPAMLLTLWFPLLFAQESNPVRVPAAEQTIAIEEITVTAQRSFQSLRFQLEEAQSRLYSAYNDSNEIDYFDVYCNRTNWTHTRIQRTLCLPAFLIEEVAEESQLGLFNGDLFIRSMPQLARGEVDPFDALRANILRVADENPLVLEALKEALTIERALSQKEAECRDKPAARILFVIPLCR